MPAAKTNAPRPQAGFTLIEVLVVVGVIVLLAGLLLAALAGARSTGVMTKSMANMRQVSTWMTLYATDNREHVVPSQFDYAPPEFTSKGKVRSLPPITGAQHAGSWTDILWTVYGLGPVPQALPAPPDGLGTDYRFDSPDSDLYDFLGTIENALRSAAPNSAQVNGGTGDTPFGSGAQAEGDAGFFAANDFFNARPDRTGAPAGGIWYVNGQIRSPERSMYLVDCFGGEVIGGELKTADLGGMYGGDADYDFIGTDATTGKPLGIVDFRYSGVCLMLFLDGHVAQEGPWGNLADLESTRAVRISDPTVR